MAVRFSKPVRQLWLNSIKRFQHKLLLVPSSPSFEQSQQRSPRIAAEVPLLPRPRGKKPRRILWLAVPREQQKPKYQPSAGPKSQKERRPLGKQSIVLRLWILYTLDSSTPSSPRASASPMECPPSLSQFQSPSKSHPSPPAEKPQGPPPSPSPPYPFTPEVHVTEGVKPTKKIKGLAGPPHQKRTPFFGN
ncbi:hypothetical protein PoB_002303800 [Plakobranchus ocellatus]|uniref:Uncharacterized protein n=1 Tax=Plakobranchus ocellatus TaxID=259542 RepID=A0AAV3ZPZ3_9GAST|nr:hypothetical protein PoB_002303800 [Plakobranchus ocellatus]